MIELVDVRKSHVTAAGTLSVLRGLNLRVEPGESVSIAGPSGCGKSTLLNLLGALDRPDAGRVLMDGQDLAALDEGALAALRNRRIGFIFQLHHLLPQCTVLENVLIPTLADKKSSSADERTQRARTLLELTGLADKADELPGRLSGGQRQRVAVARAMIKRPAVLLADEPTGSLDEDTAAAIADLLIDLNRQQGVTLIVVTHSLALAKRMNRRYKLDHGKLEPLNP
jgi:lipoprotein-releasing system ATP-binding protein